LNNESVAVIQQAKKDVNVEAVFVNMADVNRRGARLRSVVVKQVSVAGVAAGGSCLDFVVVKR
jgi:hypothetical protein